MEVITGKAFTISFPPVLLEVTVPLILVNFARYLYALILTMAFDIVSVPVVKPLYLPPSVTLVMSFQLPPLSVLTCH